MGVVAEHVGQVLMQVAAVRHGHQLHAPADPEQRQVGGERGAHEHQLRGVPLRLEVDGRVRRLAVQRRVDVRTAGEHDAVEPVEDVGVRIVRGDEHGTPAAGVHGVHVRQRQHRRERVVEPEPGFLRVRGQPDHRP